MMVWPIRQTGGDDRRRGHDDVVTTTTAPARRPAKKTTAAKKAATSVRKIAAAETAPAPATSPKGKPKDTIVFGGRTLRVKKPTAEQLAAWQYMSERESQAGPPIDEVRAQKLYRRIRRTVNSLLVDEVDIDWLDDEFLAGELTLEQATNIITDTIDLYFKGEAAPKTGPKSKARLKK